MMINGTPFNRSQNESGGARATFPATRSFVGRAVRVVLYVAFLASFVLAIGETAARAAYVAPWYEQLVSQQQQSADYAYERNRYGLRDVDYPEPKPSTCRRVLILGDSFTFGLGVPDNTAVFPKILERELNLSVHIPDVKRVDVLNGGIPGSFTTDWLHLFRQVADTFDPDVVLAVFFLRDGTNIGTQADFFAPIREGIVRRNSRSVWYRYSYLYRNVRDYLDQRVVSREHMKALTRSYFGTTQETREWRAAQENLREIGRYAKDRGSVFGMAIFPVLVQLNEDYYFTSICDLIEAFARQENIPVHSLLPAFLGHSGPDLWVSSLNQHPNAVAHRIAAESLLPFTTDLLEKAETQRQTLNCGPDIPGREQ